MQFLFLIIMVFYSTNSALAKMQEFQTTRLMQSAGTGVGSLLINEATVLNPASIVFIPRSTLNYQRGTKALQEKDDARTKDYKEGSNEFVSIQDTSTPLKGGFSYNYENAAEGTRKRFALSSAGAVGKNTSFGLLYKYINEDSGVLDNSYHQFTLGVTQILSENITFGLVMVDPQNKIREYSHNIIGVQYNMNDFFQLLADVGSGDNANPEKEAISRFALQLNSFEYFFFRYGKFFDKYQNLKGIGYGISWVGPKFSIDYAIKNAEIISKNSDTLYKEEKLVETSFAISALF